MKLTVALVLALVAVVSTWPAPLGTRQRVKVYGYLTCGEDKPAANILVKLVDEDRGPNPDDYLDRGYTNDEGMFEMEGETSEASNIDPILKVYSDCNDGIIPCQRKWRLTVPDSYINSEKAFFFGRMNLEVRTKDESRDCIH